MADRDPLGHLTAGPVFIVGMSRSGTTWVTDIFASHPAVCAVYESWLLSAHAGLGRLFEPPHDWEGERGSGVGRLLPRDELLDEVRGLASRLLARALEPHHRFLVEKSGSHAYAMPVISELFPSARFIHVLRDGRDVAVSVRAATKTWAPDWSRTFGKSITRAAQGWSAIVEAAREHGARLGPDRFLEVRYETVKADPHRSYARMFDFAGMPYDASLLDDVFARTDFDRNYSADETKARRAGRVGDWRTSFNMVDVLRFKRGGNRTLVATGYEPTPRWRGPVRRVARPALDRS